jgi:protease IV
MTDLPPAEGAGSSPPPPPPMATPMAYAYAPPPAPPAPTRRRYGVLAIVLAVLLGLSMVANAVMLLITLVLAGSLLGGESEEGFVERLIEKGPTADKIAVIRIEGIVNEEMALVVRSEAERAARDATVKAVILRINSPGGGLTASDMIYHDIRSLLVDEGKPVVASMDAVAASGGYYIACAAGDIIAQQTTVTGSIGVIAQFFFIKGLLSDKLGVNTVTLKMGSQKDWPNLFAADMPPEQQQYFMDVLLKPGYDQFVQVVADSRQLKREEVLALATGRVFMAREAEEKKLVDKIGYFDMAVSLAKKRAGITGEARVVEYARPFRLSDLVGLESKARAGVDLKDLSPERLTELAAPKVLLLWTGY